MRHLSLCVHGTLVLCIAAVVGCGGSARGTGPAATGSLTVTITPADGVTPSVVITGPKGYNNTIGTSQTLTGLTVGNYTIVADSATAPDSVVGTIIDTGAVTGSPAAVTASTTPTVTVAYSTKHRVGGLWVANIDYGTIPEFSSNQLRATGAPVPAETLATSHSVNGPAGAALDPNGNMWLSLLGTDSLLMYTPAARNTGGSTAPSTVMTSAAFNYAQDLTFDAHGNLWVANCAGGNILEFTPAQQAAGGAETPTVTISGGVVVTCPISIAFDSGGNAWVADDGGNHIVEYSATQLAVSGASTPTPVDTIGANSGSLACTDAVAFDAAQNLWVANDCAPTTVVEYTRAQLAAGPGAPAPNVIITLPSGGRGAADPFGMAFDKRGTLWVSDANNEVMLGVTSAQLAATGSPSPVLTLSVTLNGSFQPEQPLFDPYATAIGVSAARLRAPAAPLGHPVSASRHRHHPPVHP